MPNISTQTDYALIQVDELEQKIITAVEEAKRLQITDQQSLSDASNYVIEFKGLKKKLETCLKMLTDPLKEEEKKYKAIINEKLSLFQTVQYNLEESVKAYFAEKQRIENERAKQEQKAKEEQAIQEAIEKEKALKEKAVSENKNPDEVKVEVAIIPEEIKPEMKLSGMNNSGLGTMALPRWRIIDSSKIPDEYYIPRILDEKKINAVRKAAGARNVNSTIPGIEYYFEETLTSR